MTPDQYLTLFSVFVLIFSVILHEIAHGYVAYWLGDPTAKLSGRLTLNPIPHIDLVGTIILPALMILSGTGIIFGWAKPVPYNPYNLKNRRWGEVLVAFAGVGINFLLAIVFALVARYGISADNVLLTNLAGLIVLRNLQLGFFNLIPIPPLDGFTVLRGILPLGFTLAFRDLENLFRSGGIFTLILVLFVFNYFLAAPFYTFVQFVFAAMI